MIVVDMMVKERTVKSYASAFVFVDWILLRSRLLFLAQPRQATYTIHGGLLQFEELWSFSLTLSFVRYRTCVFLPFARRHAGENWCRTVKDFVILSYSKSRLPEAPRDFLK